MKYDRINKISILQQTPGQDEYGEHLDKWDPVKTDIWASKLPLLGNEYFSSVAIQSKVEVKFECAFINGITDTMRVQCGDEIYEILSAINVKSLNRDLLLYCKKVV